MRSGGGSHGYVSAHIGGDWWTHPSTYHDHTPILDISCGSMTVTFSIADRKTGDSALEFAQELASQAAKFAAEVERLRGLRDGNGEGHRAGAGEAA